MAPKRRKVDQLQARLEALHAIRGRASLPEARPVLALIVHATLTGASLPTPVVKIPSDFALILPSDCVLTLNCHGRLTLKELCTSQKAAARLLRSHGIDPTPPVRAPARAPPQAEIVYDQDPFVDEFP